MKLLNCLVLLNCYCLCSGLSFHVLLISCNLWCTMNQWSADLLVSIVAAVFHSSRMEITPNSQPKSKLETAGFFFYIYIYIKHTEDSSNERRALVAQLSCCRSYTSARSYCKYVLRVSHRLHLSEVNVSWMLSGAHPDVHRVSQWPRHNTAPRILCLRSKQSSRLLSSDKRPRWKLNSALERRE